MTLTKLNNIILKGSKDFLADAIFPESKEKLPLVIFVHGYKGYKDWGAWELMGEKIAGAGFYFVKFNFSHNGTSLEHPNEFADLEAFGQNNYSKEMDDLEAVINHFKNNSQINDSKIILMGHSRGGGISIIKASENKSITKLITLASVSSLSRFPEGKALKSWENDGFYFVENARTKQQMPHYFQFFEDYKNNEERLDVEKASKKIDIPALIIHGSADESVRMDHSEKLHQWIGNSELIIIDNANHTFGAKEPWGSSSLPNELNSAVEYCIDFLKK